MKLKLDEVLMTSVRLTDIAGVYHNINSDMSALSGSYVHLFNGEGPGDAYFSVLNQLWNNCALTEDALNQSATVVVRYVNAVCAEDGEAAAELKNKAEGLNHDLEQQENENGLNPGDLGGRAPEVDDTPEDGVVDEPDYTESTKPPGVND